MGAAYFNVYFTTEILEAKKGPWCSRAFELSSCRASRGICRPQWNADVLRESSREVSGHLERRMLPMWIVEWKKSATLAHVANKSTLVS